MVKCVKCGLVVIFVKDEIGLVFEGCFSIELIKAQTSNLFTGNLFLNQRLKKNLSNIN